MNAAIKVLFLFLILIVVSSFTLLAPTEARALVYEAYYSNDVENWEKGLEILHAQYRDQPESSERLLNLVLGTYGYIGFSLSLEKEVDDQIDETMELLEELKGREGYESHGEAIYGALLGIKIGIKPLRAITLGPKSEKALKKALALDGENPIAWVEMGNMRYHAPGIFGGSNTEAIRCYKKAIILFDQQEELRTNNWQYLHALAWLGQAYENEGDQELAIESYEKALAVAPAFVWVKDELLPAAKE